MSRKLLYGFVKNNFEKEGFIFLTTIYRNAKQKLNYICPKGHYHNISWDCWQRGQRCPYCSGQGKLTIQFIRSEFKKEGYTLLTKIYENSKQKFNYICSKGHKHFVSWDNWSRGCRCPVCFHIKQGMTISGSGHPNWKGGISCEPYCQDWTKEFKDFIKERDGHRCLNPYCNSKNPNDLTIHHIDYNKKNCDPRNLITICRSCNSRANKNRQWHTDWYQAIIYRRYLSS